MMKTINTKRSPQQLFQEDNVNSGANPTEADDEDAEDDEYDEEYDEEDDPKTHQ